MRLWDKLAEKSPDSNGDGKISPNELHQHFDADQDGVVDMLDYARHINLHAEHPEWLEKETAALKDPAATKKAEEDVAPASRIRARAQAPVNLGELAAHTAAGGLAGAIPGALYGIFSGWRGGKGQILHDMLVGSAVGAAPSALFGALGNYDEQKKR